MAYSTKCEMTVQWNPVNTVINGPKKFGGNNEVTVLTRVSLQENVWSYLPVGQKKVAVISRRLYYRGGHKQGYHCILKFRLGTYVPFPPPPPPTGRLYLVRCV